MCGRIAQIESLENRTLFAVTVTEAMTPAGSQLQVAGTGSSDKITVLRVDRGYQITAQAGFTATYRGKYKSLSISTGRGNDRVVVSPLVTIPATVSGGAGDDTLVGGSGDDHLYGNGGKDVIYGEAGNDTLVATGGTTADVLTGGLGADGFWADQSATERVLDLSKAEANRGALHRVGAFLSTAVPQSTLAVGAAPLANLPDPAVHDADVSYVNYAGHPLFGASGPTANDVQQGDIGDCYLLATLAAVAQTDPAAIRQTVVDLGDGTYAVRFRRGGNDVYVHVDADLPSWSKNNLAYADFGADGSMWAAVIEKAFALYRSDEASYSSIDTGWMTEAFGALGLKSTSYDSAYAISGKLEEMLKQNEAITYATAEAPAGSNLMSYHAYSVDHVVRNTFGGISAVVLRNPWGTDGAGSDGSNDGYVTVSLANIAAAFSGVVAA
ncbi:MAG TPA: C2 family cysteine protease [Tepidisphaeraceae bacterium]|jgi:hypothetical protein